MTRDGPATTREWRDAGTGALTRAGADAVPVEERLHHVTIPPWVDGSRVHFRADIGLGAPSAERHLTTLPDDALWMWSDGSDRTPTVTCLRAVQQPRLPGGAMSGVSRRTGHA